MKQILAMVLCILIVSVFVCSCSNKTDIETTNQSTSDIETNNNETSEIETTNIYNKVDIDITKLSSTMAYSLVVNMCNMPDEYTGDIVKMQGGFGTYQDPITKKMYFACLFFDSTACCSVSIEFETKDKLNYPADYPINGELITVTGVFDTYYEGENRYCYLKNAVIV